MAQRDTATVAVLFMKPAFVTTPKKDMGGMLLVELSTSVAVNLVPFSRDAERRIFLTDQTHVTVHSPPPRPVPDTDMLPPPHPICSVHSDVFRPSTSD
jgi:hypothetical protein